jgi:hypothetical protein
MPRAFTIFHPARVLHYWLSGALAMIAMALLSGCADTAPVRPDEAVAVGKVVVVGRLRVIHEGEDNQWSLFRPARIYVARDGKGKAFSQELMRSDGMFYLPLKPGEYMFVGASFNNPKSWTEGVLARTKRVGARFTVPKGAESVYIGTIKIEAVQGGYVQSVINDHEIAAMAYQDKYPDTATPGLALMDIDQRIGAYNLIQQACSADWGIDCTGKFAGVIPTYPPVETNNFPVVSSLQPTFSWEPSTIDGVHYDLVLYRSVSYGTLGIGGHHLPGQVVEYRQGLVEPGYQPSKPLEPNEKYFWSVRLRRDGIVSSWSRFSYLNFMIFAYTSGHSSWFGFATPGNDK